MESLAQSKRRFHCIMIITTMVTIVIMKTLGIFFIDSCDNTPMNAIMTTKVNGDENNESDDSDGSCDSRDYRHYLAILLNCIRCDHTQVVGKEVSCKLQYETITLLE